MFPNQYQAAERSAPSRVVYDEYDAHQLIALANPSQPMIITRYDVNPKCIMPL